MNVAEVIRIEKPGVTTLLYSHDDGFTRHAVDIYPDGRYVCRLNESACFRRGTHDRMARLHGFELTSLHSAECSSLCAEGEPCSYCGGAGEIEADNNGPIGTCPICTPNSV